MNTSFRLARAANMPGLCETRTHVQALSDAKFALLAKRGMLPLAGAKSRKAFLKARPEYRKVQLSTGWHGQIMSVWPAGQLPTAGPKVYGAPTPIVAPAAITNAQPSPRLNADMPAAVQRAKTRESKTLARQLARQVDKARQLEALRASLPANLR